MNIEQLELSADTKKYLASFVESQGMPLEQVLQEAIESYLHADQALRMGDARLMHLVGDVETIPMHQPPAPIDYVKLAKQCPVDKIDIWLEAAKSDLALVEEKLRKMKPPDAYKAVYFFRAERTYKEIISALVDRKAQCD